VRVQNVERPGWNKTGEVARERKGWKEGHVETRDSKRQSRWRVVVSRVPKFGKRSSDRAVRLQRVDAVVEPDWVLGCSLGSSMKDARPLGSRSEQRQFGT